MCRYVLLAIVVILLALMVAAALVVQEYGWQGFLVMIAGLVVVGYFARKAMRPLFLHLITRPLRKLGAALRGARILVHSITPCEAPSPENYDPEMDADDCGYDDEQAIEDWRNEDEPNTDDDRTPESWSPLRLDWYQVEFTVIPPDAGSSEGRIVHRRSWNPQMISAVGPRPELARSNPLYGWQAMMPFTGSVQNTFPELWNGSEYAVSEQEVFGERRLRMRIGVGREIQTVTVTYAHYTNIGEVRIPRIDVSPEPMS
jgi:hypothetical protein